MRIYELFLNCREYGSYLFRRHSFQCLITSSFLSLGFFLIFRLLNASEKVDEGIVGFLRIEVAHISLGGGEIAVDQQLFNDTAVKLGFFCNFGE